VTEDASQGGLPRPSPLFQVATLPALLIGFRRRRIQASVLTDLVTFAGPVGQVTFAVLAVAAVLYPIVASLAHANVTAFTSIRNGTSAFDFAIFPLFDMVYAESLPFMAAAAVIGLFSPALGALFVAVFVPADLLAAGASGELATTPSQPGFSAVLARVISYVMLWFLAVEIPLLVRAIGDAVGTWTSSRSTLGTVAARVVAAGVLMLIWARSLPWVIVPVFTWSSIQVVQNLAIRPTWFYWQLLVAVAALAAGVAAFWPGFPASRPV
jgi:hypothetical protein